MNESSQLWMQQVLSMKGVVGCGARQADRSVVVGSCNPDFSEDRLQQIHRKLSDAVFALQQNEVSVKRLHWTFQEAQLWCIVKPRGILAMVITQGDQSIPSEIERALEAFE
jgi:hypothetical protein